VTGRALMLLAAGAVVVTGLALFGSALAPHDPTAPVGVPWSPPGAGLLLGTDGLGRDVWSRVLAGGRDVAAVSALAATAASGVGVTAGLVAGWSAGRAARVLTGLADLLLAVPLLLLAMVLAVALPGPVAVVVGTVCGGAPLTLRVVADATVAVRDTGYVQAARTRGERTPSILLREVLPALSGLAGADVAARFVVALQLAAALSLLGFGPPPPTPDWAAMIRENLPGVALNPAAMAAPAAALALLAIAVAALGQTAGRARGAGR
jgi:peptide/nickel transport system permease protein